MPRPLAPLKVRPLSLASILVIAVAQAACGPAGDAGPEAERPPESAEAEGEGGRGAGPVEAEVWLDQVHVGHQVDPDGAMPMAQRADDFAVGERIYVSMDVSGAPELAAVHVVFRDDAGETVAEDEKKVPAEAAYLYFDSGDTSHWRAGGYRVVVAVDGEPVAERGLTLTENPLEPKGEPR